MSTRKQIRAVIRHDGEVDLDLAGYVGQACVEEETRLRQALAALGLAARVDSTHEKSADQQQRERHQLNPRSCETQHQTLG